MFNFSKKTIRCDVSDALLKLKHPHGGFLSNITLWSPQRQEGSTKVVGPAYTVKYVLNTDVNAPKLEGHYVSLEYKLGTRRLENLEGLD
jgi:hypothetical protein